MNVALESYGPDSRCFEQDDRWVMKVNGTVISRQTTFGAGCYQVIETQTECLVKDVTGVISGYICSSVAVLAECSLMLEVCQ